MSAQERRDQLLDVLSQIVLAEGYGAVSIDRVSRDAQIARTVIYSHFGNLEGMLHALIERTEQRAVGQIREVIPDIDFEEDPDTVLIEADGVYALGKKPAAVGVDKPEHTVALVNAKETAAAETIIGDSAPSCSSQSDTPATDQLCAIYRIGRSEALDISQDRPAFAAHTLSERKGAW